MVFISFVWFQEQNFAAVYVDLERTERGEFQSLVQISTMPVFVGRGAGTNQGEWILLRGLINSLINFAEKTEL